MRTLLVGILLLVSALRVGAQEKGLAITPLARNYYIYTTWKPIDGTPFPANGMYVVTDAGVVLIDSPWDEEQTRPLLDSIQRRHGKRVVACIATHSHDDRTGSFDILRAEGVRTYSTARTLELCREKGNKQAEFPIARDTTFNIGGVTFSTFYPGAGHTEDNIVIWFPGERVLYGGCFVKSTESRGLGYIAEADLDEWPRSIRKVMKKFRRPRFVIPGHQRWESTGALAHTLRLLREAAKAD